MSKIEYVDLSGLRLDGRRPRETRRISAKMGVNNRADGSAFFEQGLTKVLASVHGPISVTSRSKELHDRATITCEFNMAAFSTGERKKHSKNDRRSTEIASAIEEAFESVILTSISPRSEIIISLEVIQADGGVRAACFNAATLALIDAGIPMKDFLCACSAGYIEGEALLDLNFQEDGAHGPDLCIAMLPNSGKIVHVNLEPKIAVDVFPSVMELSITGCKQVYEVLKYEVRENTLNQLKSRGLRSI